MVNYSRGFVSVINEEQPRTSVLMERHNQGEKQKQKNSVMKWISLRLQKAPVSSSWCLCLFFFFFPIGVSCISKKPAEPLVSQRICPIPLVKHAVTGGSTKVQVLCLEHYFIRAKVFRHGEAGLSVMYWPQKLPVTDKHQEAYSWRACWRLYPSKLFFFRRNLHCPEQTRTEKTVFFTCF